MKKSKHNFKASYVRKEMKGILIDAVNVATEELSNAIKKELSKTDSRPPNQAPTAPSGPGLRTGKLRRSFRTRKAKRVGNRITTTLGSNVKYARYLEFGADLKGGQPYFFSKKIAKKQKTGPKIPNIAFAKKSSPFAKNMPKTKPSKLKPRPYLKRTLRDSEVIKRVRAVAQRQVNVGLRNLRSKAPNI